MISQVQFVPNKGQWPKKAYYKADLVNGNLWLTDSGLLFSLWDADAAENMHDRALHRFPINRHAFYLYFKNGNFSNIVTTGTQSETYYNYFLGNNPANWAAGVHANSELLVKSLYPGVDLRIFSQNGQLKYNLECKNIEATAAIEMQYIGAEAKVDGNKKINVSTSVQDFVDAMPLVYSENENGRFILDAAYKQKGKSFYYQINSNVASADRIVIDPVLVFSTYTGSRADNFGCTGTYDDLGNGFAGGTVFNVGLPVTTGAFQTTFGGGVEEGIGYGDDRDAAILKFNSLGTKLIYGTYLGGANNEQPHSMVATDTGTLYVMGSTRSKNFPISAGAYDNSHNGDYDFFVSAFSADGKQLLGSTYIGGNGLDGVGANREVESIDNFPLLYNYADEFRGEIITDGLNVYVGGSTYSTNFPRSNNSGWYGGKEDACVFSLSIDLKKLNWAQLLGMDGHDAFYGIAFGKHNDVFASGGSTSVNLPSSFPKFANTYKGGIADG
ncbi:MAG: hypothetical protein IT244_00005, partial [Bacteroidia bacterium]|nr:hypothetical protein [Bacteroidia bacterium]